MTTPVKLDELCVPVRVQNMFANEQIVTIEQLLAKTDFDLLRCYNFGKKSLRDLKGALAEHGLWLAQRNGNVPAPLAPRAPTVVPQVVREYYMIEITALLKRVIGLIEEMRALK